MRHVYKYLPHYAKGATAEFLDGEPFKPIIKLGETSEKMSEKMSEKIISLISKNPKITAAEMAKELGKSSRTIERKIRELKQNNRIKRIGPDKGGYWKITESRKD
ncbi:winged helix-turn-helix transcriptional regulator [Caldithrix abyssi]